MKKFWLQLEVSTQGCLLREEEGEEAGLVRQLLFFNCPFSPSPHLPHQLPSIQTLFDNNHVDDGGDDVDSADGGDDGGDVMMMVVM